MDCHQDQNADAHRQRRPQTVKVDCRNGDLFDGLVSQPEGDSAANLARNVSGVAKVVKVFEYIN